MWKVGGWVFRRWVRTTEFCIIFWSDDYQPFAVLNSISRVKLSTWLSVFMQNLFEGEWLNFNYDLIRQRASERERETEKKNARHSHCVLIPRFWNDGFWLCSLHEISLNRMNGNLLKAFQPSPYPSKMDWDSRVSKGNNANISYFWYNDFQQIHAVTAYLLFRLQQNRRKFAERTSILALALYQQFSVCESTRIITEMVEMFVKAPNMPMTFIRFNACLQFVIELVNACS